MCFRAQFFVFIAACFHFIHQTEENKNEWEKVAKIGNEYWKRRPKKSCRVKMETEKNYKAYNYMRKGERKKEEEVCNRFIRFVAVVVLNIIWNVWSFMSRPHQHSTIHSPLKHKCDMVRLSDWTHYQVPELIRISNGK